MLTEISMIILYDYFPYNSLQDTQMNQKKK